MNLAEAQAEFAARGFDYLSPGRMTSMLNDAKNDFEDAWRFPWLEASVIAPAPLSLSDLKLVRYVQDVDRDLELYGVDVALIAQNGSPLDLPGAPTHWWLQGPDPAGVVRMNVWPVAAPNLQVRYVRESPELALGTDTPLIPARYHGTWLDLAVVQGYIDSDNFNAAAALRQIANQSLLSIIERYETVNRQHQRLMSARAPSEDD